MSSMTGRLRSLWNAPPAIPAPPKRVWRDWVLVAILPLIATIEAFARTDLAAPIPSLIVTVALVPLLLWRRTHPLLMLVIAFAVSNGFRLLTGGEPQLYTLVFVLLLVYSVFRWGSGRAIAIGGALVLGVTAASAVLEPMPLVDTVGAFVVVALASTVGLLFRLRASFRMRELDRARSNEREGLARDLHDTVAHHVSAIAIQAQAGIANPAGAEAALQTIEAEASRTLAEMRAMVRVLRRDESVDLTPAPGIAEVRQLATDAVIEGDPSTVPTAVSQAIYRIAQESITNSRRHARDATRVDVRITIAPDRVRLTVHDDGTTASATAPGFGITGMQERAALLGGTLAAGPAPDGGWRVTAEFPA